MEGIVALRLTALKHSAVVIGRHFDQMSELQAARVNGLDVRSGDILNSVFGPRGSPKTTVFPRAER
jgi:hypothetical protein